MVERFHPSLHYPTDTASAFAIDCGIWPTVRAVIMPGIRTEQRALLITALQSSGPLDTGTLARAIRDLHACKIAVVRRFQHREGPDHWAVHYEMVLAVFSNAPIAAAPPATSVLNAS
jgi:hypothetical protein